MDNTCEKLVSWLFDTKAVRVCPQDKPFWYTSGSIGPYYVNTHFLYGSEQKANELLKFIDSAKEEVISCPSRVLEQTRENYNNDTIFRGLMDQMIEFIKKNISIDEVDYISGGERRDWFFSLLAAEMLQKPHITIYKDMSAVVSVDGKIEELKDLGGKNVLHIADLITEASSYERAWIPAVKEKGGTIKWSVVVVDRLQGGEKVLNNYGIKSLAMVGIDKKLFDNALEMGYINVEQHKMIINYIDNPKESMRSFLIEHPEFLNNALAADEKTRERAELCISKNIYSLK